jgi:pyruvate formate lyase activating enzyme
VDWPGELAAVVFCQGCAWNCKYCHNAALRSFGAGDRPWSEVLAWIETRQALLDAVVFSGGEPLLQPGLPQAMEAVRGLGFKTGLHTSGMDPAALGSVLPLTDWIGLDIKAPRAAYERITGRPGSADAIWASMDLLRKSGVAFELRTTWHPDLLSEGELTALARELSALETAEWVLQAFQPQGCADQSLVATGRARVPGKLVESLRAVLGPGVALRVRE